MKKPVLPWTALFFREILREMVPVEVRDYLNRGKEKNSLLIQPLLR